MTDNLKTIKPLNSKAYGSIPHLPGSRLGPKDYCITQGQAIIATEKARDRQDLIICQEKLDGSNVAVAKLNGKIIALTRAGYPALSSPYIQHHFFDAFVRQNKARFEAALLEGERICGEWLAMAHGTRYNLQHETLVVFDLFRDNHRICYDELYHIATGQGFITPHVLHTGGPFSIEAAVQAIGSGGYHGAIDPVEGAVWRVERKGKVDFLCKFVRHDKKDGSYLPEINGGVITWNIDICKEVYCTI